MKKRLVCLILITLSISFASKNLAADKSGTTKFSELGEVLEKTLSKLGDKSPNDIILIETLSEANTMIIGDKTPDDKKLGEMMVILAKGTNSTELFFTKFYKTKAWDAKRSVPIPGDMQTWTLSNFQPAMDASTRKPIDWGPNGDRYVALDIKLNKENKPHPMIDDLLKTKNSMTFVLNLYEYNGKFVKTISKWGYLIGDSFMGIVYMQEGNYATFLSNVPVKKGGSFTYQTVDGEMNEASNLVDEDDMLQCYRTGELPNRADNIAWQMSSSFPAKPTFDAKKTETLNKIINESPFLQAKFYQGMVFDAGRRSWPEPNKPWSFWTMVIAQDMANLCLLDWGPNGDRYVQFDIEFEGKRNFSALTDDRYSTGQRFIFPLRLYEKDGRFVKTVSSFGNFFGFGEGSFIYIQEVKNINATFFTKLPVEYGKPFSYNVKKDRITKISELLDFKPAQ
ncbi:MAG: hypothetical protein WC055_01405 [Melioribacteraceae bacterium]